MSGVSVAVNVFFRSLEPGQYSTGRDVYGNKDLPAYDKGRQDINRITHAFSKVPASCRQFYLLRLADELADKARDTEDEIQVNDQSGVRTQSAAPKSSSSHDRD